MKKFIPFTRVRIGAVTGILLAGLVFTACKKSDNGNNNNNIPVSGLMVFNLSPDVTQAGFTISGNNLTNSPLAFNSYSGGYLSVYSGSRSLQSYSFNSGNSLATTTYDFDSSKYYSAFLVGTDTTYRNII